MGSSKLAVGPRSRVQRDGNDDACVDCQTHPGQQTLVVVDQVNKIGFALAKTKAKSIGGILLSQGIRHPSIRRTKSLCG